MLDVDDERFFRNLVDVLASRNRDSFPGVDRALVCLFLGCYMRAPERGPLTAL